MCDFDRVGRGGEPLGFDHCLMTLLHLLNEAVHVGLGEAFELDGGDTGGFSGQRGRDDAGAIDVCDAPAQTGGQISDPRLHVFQPDALHDLDGAAEADNQGVVVCANLGAGAGGWRRRRVVGQGPRGCGRE